MKNIPSGREEEKRGFEKIDGQLSKREKKLRESKSKPCRNQPCTGVSNGEEDRESCCGRTLLSHSQAGIYL